MARQQPFRLAVPKRSHLDKRCDLLAGEKFVDCFAVSCLVVRQGLDPFRW